MRNDLDVLFVVVVILGFCLLLLSLGTISRCNRLLSVQQSMEQRICELERILEDRK